MTIKRTEVPPSVFAVVGGMLIFPTIVLTHTAVALWSGNAADSTLAYKEYIGAMYGSTFAANFIAILITIHEYYR